MKYIGLPLVSKFKNYGYNPQAHIGKGSYVIFIKTRDKLI